MFQALLDGLLKVLTPEMVGSYARHALTAVFGAAAFEQYATQDMWGTVAAGGAMVVVIVWSYLSKKLKATSVSS